MCWDAAHPALRRQCGKLGPKSTLNSNIGTDFKLFLSNLFSFFRYCDVYVFLFSKINGLLGDMDIRIANKYRLGRKIGGGSFGDIYLGKLK